MASHMLTCVSLLPTVHAEIDASVTFDRAAA